MLVASTIIWGISKADTLLNPQEVNTEPATSFSIIGSVTEVAETTIGIDVNANKEVNGTTTTTDSFDTTNISSVQTNHFTNISLSDIKIGNNIILQGVKRGESIQIFKIFSYGNEVATGILTEEINTLATTTEPIVATSTATSTDDTSTSTATTTLDASVIPAPVSTSTSSGEIQSENEGTETSTSSASSTPSIADVVKDVVGNIIDALDGTNSTSTDTTPSNQTPSDTTETPQTPTTDISEIFEGYTNPLGNLIPEETLPTTETPPAPEAPPAPTLDINQPTV
jgi:hypothetical protein